MKFFSRGTLLVAGFMVGFLLIEGLLRLFLPANPFSPHFPLFPNTKVVNEIAYPGVSNRSVLTTNRWGLRGENPPADWAASYTIVTIGGSTTRCTYLDDSKTWPHLLQTNLRQFRPDVWVGNAGIDGQTTRAHKLLMREVISKIKPDMVLFLIGINDLGLSLREDRKTLGIAADRPQSRRWKVLTRTRLGQILYDWKRVIIDKVPVVQFKPADQFKPLAKPFPLPDDLNAFLPLHREFQQNIRDLVGLSRAMRIRPVFLTQPMLFDDRPSWQKIEGAFYWIQGTQGKLSAADHWKLLNHYNHLLLKTCRQEQVECFDLASVIPHEKAYFIDSVHFTERGAKLVADAVAKYLRDKIANAV